MFRYIFSAFTTSSVLAIKRTSVLWSSPLSCSVVLMSPWCLLRLWDGSLVTLHSLCSYIYYPWWSQCTSLRRGTEFLKAVKWLSSLFQYIYIYMYIYIYIYYNVGFNANNVWTLPLAFYSGDEEDGGIRLSSWLHSGTLSCKILMQLLIPLNGSLFNISFIGNKF